MGIVFKTEFCDVLEVWLFQHRAEGENGKVAESVLAELQWTAELIVLQKCFSESFHVLVGQVLALAALVRELLNLFAGGLERHKVLAEEGEVALKVVQQFTVFI